MAVVPVEVPILTVVYLIAMVLVGVWASRFQKTIDDFLVGNRGVGAWVTALSHQATAMSGWMTLGYPGFG